jgi:hypothetical protein
MVGERLHQRHQGVRRLKRLEIVQWQSEGRGETLWVADRDGDYIVVHPRGREPVCLMCKSTKCRHVRTVIRAGK